MTAALTHSITVYIFLLKIRSAKWGWLCCCQTIGQLWFTQIWLLGHLPSHTFQPSSLFLGNVRNNAWDVLHIFQKWPLTRLLFVFFCTFFNACGAPQCVPVLHNQPSAISGLVDTVPNVRCPEYIMTHFKGNILVPHAWHNAPHSKWPPFLGGYAEIPNSYLSESLPYMVLNDPRDLWGNSCRLRLDYIRILLGPFQMHIQSVWVAPVGVIKASWNLALPTRFHSA